jgi:SAM-dependent methyltransferase
MNQYIESNRRYWDELVQFHIQPNSTYDIESFRQGRSTLMGVEREEVGDVRGKTLLHLQCHFGMDTHSWAREGAVVTGVDFSPQAVEVARSLASELGIEANFVESDVYELPGTLDATFDVVFASYGVICWLPDFPAWVRIAASYLRPGGFLHLLDDHPVSQALAEDASAGSLRLDFPYFAAAGAMMFEADGSYATDAKLENRRSYEFNHDLGEIVNALVDSGLQIESLHEFPFAGWQRLPLLQRGPDAYWRLPDEDRLKLPFLFSVKARKPTNR